MIHTRLDSWIVIRVPSNNLCQTQRIVVYHDNMPIQVSDSLRKWLKTNELEWYLRVADTEPHPPAVEVVKEINVDKISNQQVCRFLNLKKEGYNLMDSLEKEVMESYFGPYSPSAKSYRTFRGKDLFSFMMLRNFYWKLFVWALDLTSCPSKGPNSLLQHMKGRQSTGGT